MIKQTDIEGIYLIEGGQTFYDDRGFFRETWRRDEFEEALGRKWQHVQENHSLSKKNVLRGIHIAPWSKLIYCPYGEVITVLVDVRPDSPTYMKVVTVHIEEGQRAKIFIPPFVGNSYYVLSDVAVYEYEVDEYYQPGMEKGVVWNDPDLAIPWSVSDPILSDKDRNNQTFKAYLESLKR